MTLDDASTQLRALEAMLWLAGEPVTLEELQQRLPQATDVPSLIQTLQQHYESRGVHLVERGGGYCFRTAPDLASFLIDDAREVVKLSRVALEVLAIIAYHQPITRAEIEEMRGVALSKSTFDQLLESGWITMAGRKEVVGRPMLWKTTPVFLDHFSLSSLADLPQFDELKAAGLLDMRAKPLAINASVHDHDEGIQEPLFDDLEPTFDAVGDDMHASDEAVHRP